MASLFSSPKVKWTVYRFLLHGIPLIGHEMRITTRIVLLVYPRAEEERRIIRVFVVVGLALIFLVVLGSSLGYFS